MERTGTAEASGRRIFRVGELAQGLRALLEDEVGRVWVVGEISNLHRARSGHSYFTLKDDEAQMRAALFRGSAVRIPFDPEDGLEVVVYGEVTLYPARGDLQIIVRHLEPRGQGALQLAFEQLRARLDAEGLFAADLKRPLPVFPRRVGIVTSPSGAAVRDVIQVSGHRFPGVPLLLSPTRVQGDGVEAEIVAALERIQRVPDVDVILLVRGGGSLEDLQGFNTERVARALRASRVPVVSGVGHEVDVTIADLAADVRAPTPSAAAALVLPDRAALASQLGRDVRRLGAAASAAVQESELRLSRLREVLRACHPSARLGQGRARFEAGRHALGRAVQARFEQARARQDTLSARLAPTPGRALSRGQRRLEALDGRLTPAPGRAVARGQRRLAGLAAGLDALSPLSVLGRGYSIVQRAEDAVIVRRAEDVAPGDALHVRLHRGTIAATVTDSDAEDG